MASVTISRKMSTDSSRSRGSSQVNEGFVRSRAWSEDIAKHWNAPIGATEHYLERAERYAQYFTLSQSQLDHVYKELLQELDLGLMLHAEDPMTTPSASQCSLKMLDTCIDKVPSGKEKAVAYALDFGGTHVRAVRAKLDGNGQVSVSEMKANLREADDRFSKGLLDKQCGAIHLFDRMALTIKDLMKRSGDLHRDAPANVGFTFSFPAEQTGIKSATLLQWTKGFETGRGTKDPVEGMDVAALMDVAFWRNEVPATTCAVVNDTAGTLLACAYNKNPRLPPCTVGFILGTGVNGAYVESRAKKCGYQGVIVNTELGGFDKGLPLTDVDLEVDFADDGGRGKQLYEKMVSGGYLGEICRRLIVKVWQHQAPSLAWARQSMPAAAASLCISDKSPSLEMTQRVLRCLWDWETTFEDREVVQRLFSLVFYRSAGLAAVGIAALAQASGRLQPAMGGVTVAVDGSLHTQNAWYADKVMEYLRILVGEENAKFLHLVTSDDGSGKGAAILAGVLNE